MIQFGKSAKRTPESTQIGQYGNGLKSYVYWKPSIGLGTKIRWWILAVFLFVPLGLLILSYLFPLIEYLYPVVEGVSGSLLGLEHI